MVLLRKSFPYLAAFFVMLAGSGLLNLPTGSLWFYVIRYGIMIWVLGIALSAWRRAKLRNEPPTDYLLLTLFVPFTNDYALHIIFVVLTVILFNKKLLLPFNSPLKPIYILFLLGLTSYIINQFIEFNPLSYPVFLVLFFLPFAFFSLFYTYASEQTKELLLQFYLKLVMMMSLIIILQTIFFWNQHPDARTGGTTHVHFAAVLLGFAFIILLDKFRFDINRFKQLAVYQKILLIITVPLLFLMDAKIIFVVLFLIIFISLFVYLKKSIYKIATGAFAVILILMLIIAPNLNLPISVLSFKYSGMSVHNTLENFSQSQKYAIIKKAAALPFDEPLTFFIGSGPGTFLSRTSMLKKYFVEGHTYNLYGAKDSVKSGFLVNLFSPANTRLEKKYNFTAIKGMSTMSSVFDWKSSVLSFYFEFGIISVLAVIYFLYKLFKKILNKQNRINYNYILMVFLILFILVLSFFNYWQEYSNYLIMQSSLLGLSDLNANFLYEELNFCAVE